MTPREKLLALAERLEGAAPYAMTDGGEDDLKAAAKAIRVLLNFHLAMEGCRGNCYALREAAGVDDEAQG